MRNERHKLSNKHLFLWKWLFILLLALNVALGLLIARRIFTIREPQLVQAVAQSKKEKHVGQIVTTTDELNSFINTYLSKHSIGADNRFKFYISSNNAVMSVDYTFFGTDIPLYIYFQPAMTTNGSIVLNVQSVSAGTLNLPPTAALSYIHSIKLPKFVIVNASASTVTLNLSNLSVDGLYFRAHTVDLANGKFVFDIFHT